MFYNITRWIFNIFYTIFFRLQVIGLDNIPLDKPLIIASNHISNLDPPTLGVACKVRPINFMAKIELFQTPIFSWAIRKLGAFPVKRGASDKNAIKTALDKLRSNLVVGIFPEGTRSKDGNLGNVGTGVITIAAKAKAVVVPTAIVGTNKISLKNLFPKIKVAFGEPIYLPEKIDDKELFVEYTDKMMQQIKELLVILKKD